jgi:16S rRNA (guanine(527)-N(7))-methyltransferase RsmG
MPAPIERFREALQDKSADFGVRLIDRDIERLSAYYALLLKWNPRLHLVAPCSPEEFATRHILESLVLIHHLPTNARVADIGSGAGLPLIPCLLVRRDLRVTLIESSQRKLIFLREALRHTNSETLARLIGGRFEVIPVPEVGFITCRALDRFWEMLPKLVDWAPANCTLLLFAGMALRKQLETMLPRAKSEQLPGSARRFLVEVNLSAQT